MASTRTSARSIGTTGFRVGAPCGFTLVELLIAVAVVAVLLSIALPSYSSAMAKLNRTSAQQFMLTIAQKEEQTALYQRSFVATIGTGGLGIAPPPDVAANYAFAVTLTGEDCAGDSVSGAAYVITATAIGAQAVDGNLCLDSVNHRTPPAKWKS